MSDFTFEDALDGFESSLKTIGITSLQWVLDHWEDAAPRCRAMLADYVSGVDHSERTERALFYIVHALGQKADTDSHADICDLVDDQDRSDLVLGEDASAVTLPCILIATFDGDPRPLQHLAEWERADETIRADAFLVLAYLTRTGRLTESWMYEYLAGVVERLGPREPNFVWFGWARAVAALGFAGLAGRAEQLIKDGLIDEQLLSAEDFWQDLREMQANPNDLDHMVWGEVGPLNDAVSFLETFDADWTPDEYDDGPMPPQPVINPMRNVGRNDPCPCGSGKKYKKCCLVA